ncbi:MAG: helicase-exonuclease AddAB subunit AddA [Clostridiales bacterium]|nr:helicase-exonuclease AddAB subunit AddA [Clostridiales bacterium]
MPKSEQVVFNKTEQPAVTWTPDQQKVIDLRDRSLLVSAAAGSGKTAVLVQRIISMITDAEHPMDVDELLVVTFTNAAAAEMRERILYAIEAAADRNPSDSHLLRQMALIHNAQITTIDSFCLHVVQNHFHRISLEPGFRIADEGELTLLREDVCDAVLEHFYQERDPAFLRFADGYAGAKSDQPIREMILRLYDYSQSYPWPDEWLDSCAGQYEAADLAELEEKQWVRDFLEYLRQRVEDLISQYRKTYVLTLEEDGPQHYESVVRDDLRQLEVLLRETAAYEAQADILSAPDTDDSGFSGSMPAAGTGDSGHSNIQTDLRQTEYESESKLVRWQEALQKIHFKSLLAKRNYEGSEEKKNAVKAARDQMKAQIRGFSEKYFASDMRSQLEVMQKTGAMVQTLVDLVKVFSTEYAKEKAKKNILDFSDVEHDALQILVNPETKQPTDTAAEYRNHFREVMIDEYQDSNYVQEALLTAVSGIPAQHENMFMVGDVKQSIYRFRLARPELFMGKYDTFSLTESRTQRIDLHQNFRSGGEVISVVNDIFGRIMGRDLGNVEYDADAALYGNDSDRTDGIAGEEKTDPYNPEFLLVEPDPSGRDNRLTEARVIAQRIRTMVSDQQTAGCRYRDIVILLRTLFGWSDAFQTAFEQEGIPLLVASRTGYFSAQEVQVVLSMLRVIDNPQQDLPLVTVMKSPIGNFSDDELAQIRITDESLPFYACVEEMVGISRGDTVIDDEKRDKADKTDVKAEKKGFRRDRELYDRVSRFWNLLNSFRERMPYTPIHLLLQQIYDETGYRNYVSALPAGEQRRANLDMLLEKAIAYEQTSYHGLFHFIRYIDRLMKYDVDYGEAETVSEQENAVRLMTIHKSKGLEFPIVFLAGMGKPFNMTDAHSSMIFHPEYGVGLKLADAERRLKTDTLIRRIFSVETKKENLGEELRVLYVAMTRAKQKLILTGMKPKKDPGHRDRMEPFEKLDFSIRMDAHCAWDWVLPALATYGDQYRLQTVGLEERVESEQKKQAGILAKKKALEKELDQVDDNVYAKVAERLSWRYPYERSEIRKQKVSVSEIKHRAMEEARDLLEADGSQSLFQEEIPIPYIPRFVQEQEENRGALRGTAFHRFLECLDFADPIWEHFSELDESEAQSRLYGYIRQLLADGRMEEKETELLNTDKLYHFLSTDIAGRMERSARQNLLTKEQPFVMTLPACRIWNDTDSEEPVLVQGIIDVFWEEEDGVVLLDYKTDRVNTPRELVLRYQEQLRLYAEALDRSFTDKKVKEILIYSFRLDQIISI